jgi:hypothetical protein
MVWGGQEREEGNETNWNIVSGGQIAKAMQENDPKVLRALKKLEEGDDVEAITTWCATLQPQQNRAVLRLQTFEITALSTLKLLSTTCASIFALSSLR